MKPYYERVAARIYYGRHATGFVILRNGYPEHHGTIQETNRLWKAIQRRVHE